MYVVLFNVFDLCVKMEYVVYFTVNPIMVDYFGIWSYWYDVDASFTL